MSGGARWFSITTPATIQIRNTYYQQFICDAHLDRSSWGCSVGRGRTVTSPVRYASRPAATAVCSNTNGDNPLISASKYVKPPYLNHDLALEEYPVTIDFSGRTIIDSRRFVLVALRVREFDALTPRHHAQSRHLPRIQVTQKGFTRNEKTWL